MRRRLARVLVVGLATGCAPAPQPTSAPPSGQPAATTTASSSDGAALAALDRAIAAVRRDDHATAARLAIEAAPALERAGDVRAALAWHLLGQVHRDRKECAEAALAYQRGLRLRERMLGPDHHDVAVSLRALADSLRWCSGDHGAAIPHFERAYRIISADPARLAERVDLAKRMATSLRELRDASRAAAVLRDAA